ncbi:MULTISPECIES: hypothetical protein [unclassified Bradyrhizobium]|uniref:hypothetical protein n=1 Tax=unclassified Bradyrhizobium TaxID=2631580 RepID=UPI002916BB9C|nr:MULTISPECIES: hypothetical protein [unclassified Bradyrhizobium]
MFDSKPSDMTATLSQMERWSRERTNFNQPEAIKKFIEYIGTDRRFDGFDAQKLAERVQHCKNYGATLDLEAPELRRGGHKRPLDRSNY